VLNLVRRGVVDPFFPRFIRDKGFHVSLAAPTDGPRLSAGLRQRLFPEIVQTKKAIGDRAPAAE
jgi:hypothetical protein